MFSEQAQSSLQQMKPSPVMKGLPLSIENAEKHGLGVQIDPAVVVMRIGVKSHGSLLEGWCLRPTSLLRVK